MEDETGGVFEMIEQPAWSCDQQVNSLLKLMSLSASLSTSNNNSVSFVMVLKKVSGPLIILHCEFTSWCNNKYTCSILGSKVCFSKEFNSWKHVSKGLATSCFGSSENISSIQDVRNCSSLNLRAGFVPKSINCFL